jgi:hypothetical protein
VRALLPSTAYAYRPCDDKLVIGLRPLLERLALFIFVAGLFLIGLPLALMANGQRISIAALVPGTMLALQGSFFLFAQPRLILDRKLSNLILVRPLCRVRYWDLQDIERIEVLLAWGMQDIKMVFKNGERLLLVRGRLKQDPYLAAKLADFVKIPLERKNVADSK